jgi:hypothetical protein
MHYSSWAVCSSPTTLQAVFKSPVCAQLTKRGAVTTLEPPETRREPFGRPRPIFLPESGETESIWRFRVRPPTPTSTTLCRCVDMPIPSWSSASVHIRYCSSVSLPAKKKYQGNVQGVSSIVLRLDCSLSGRFGESRWSFRLVHIGKALSLSSSSHHCDSERTIGTTWSRSPLSCCSPSPCPLRPCPYPSRSGPLRRSRLG